MDRDFVTLGTIYSVLSLEWFSDSAESVRYSYSDSRNLIKIAYQQFGWMFQSSHIFSSALPLQTVSHFPQYYKFKVYETIVFTYSYWSLRNVASKEHKRIKCTELFFCDVCLMIPELSLSKVLSRCIKTDRLRHQGLSWLWLSSFTLIQSVWTS